MPNKILEVTAVTIATEAGTGKRIYQVRFGQPTQVDSELLKYMPQQSGGKPPKVLFYDVMVLFFNFENAVPYKVGSKWELEIKKSGEVSLKESK